MNVRGCVFDYMLFYTHGSSLDKNWSSQVNSMEMIGIVQ